MKVESLTGTRSTAHSQELSAWLSDRTEKNDNVFWLTVDQPFPELSILVRDKLATLRYLPNDCHPGFVSIGDVMKKGDVRFRISESRADDLMISQKSLVSIEDAELAAIEFLQQATMPKSVRWMEL